MPPPGSTVAPEPKGIAGEDSDASNSRQLARTMANQELARKRRWKLRSVFLVGAAIPAFMTFAAAGHTHAPGVLGWGLFSTAVWGLLWVGVVLLSRWIEQAMLIRRYLRNTR